MLPILKPFRQGNVTVQMHVDPEGLRFETLKHFESHEVQFSSWKMLVYPDAFVASAEFSLKGYKGYHHEFIASAENDLVYGAFRARQDTNEWVDFSITIDGKLVTTSLRASIVRKVIYIVRHYWNMGNEIVHQGQRIQIDIPYVTPEELNQTGLDDLPLRN
jgi:hypothetical protein